MPKDERVTTASSFAAESASIDPETVAAIAREVIARLQHQASKDANSQTESTATSVSDRVVTANTIAQLSGTPTQLLVPNNAVVTPAACDEARQRGLAITRGAPEKPDRRPHAQDERLQIRDSSDPQRADAVAAVLSRRGVCGPANILLSDSPARDVYQHCRGGNEVAVMITTLNDIARFAEEIRPTLWVFDMKRLNLAAAVNAVAAVTRIGHSPQ